MKHCALALEILGLAVAVLEMLHAQPWVGRVATRVREAGLQTSYAASLFRTSIVPLAYPAEIPPWWLDTPASILFFFFAPFVAGLALLAVANLFGVTPLSQRVALVLVGIPLVLSCLAYLFGAAISSGLGSNSHFGFGVMARSAFGILGVVQLKNSESNCILRTHTPRKLWSCVPVPLG